MASFSWPPTGGRIAQYSTLSAFPTAASQGNGAAALALDTDILYISNGTSWLAVAGASAALSVGALDGQSANAQGLTLTGNTLYQQSATGSYPGLVNTTTQTFAGNKTFSGTIGASNLSGTNTGDVTIGTANGLSLASQALSLQAATTSLTGALTSTDWNTFNNKLASTDGAYSLANTSDATKLQKWDLSGQTTGTTLTVSPVNTSNMALHIPQVATAAGAGMALVQDETTGFIFSYGISSSIGAANSMMQLANASTANRAQIKLHSYFNGASVAGVSTLTSRSGTIGTNAAIVAGQDYSKWTAQASATTPGSAPISGTWSFKANTVNSLTVTSDFHLQLTNLAGTLADRLYLSSEGLLQLPGYSTGIAHFDSSGNITSSAIVNSDLNSVTIVHKRYIDFISGDDSTGTGSLFAPWKTLQHAYNSITPTINEPYTFYLSGGNNDTDSAITAKPNVNLASDYLIQVTPSFTISGGSTNDTFTATNITFVSSFTWSRNDASEIMVNFNNVQVNGALTVKQAGAGNLLLVGKEFAATGVTEFQVGANGAVLLYGCTFFGGSLTFDDAPNTAYYEILGGYLGEPVTISGGAYAYFSGIQADVPFGYTLTGATTANGTPVFQSDSGSVPPTISGAFTLALTSYAQHESYTPTTAGNWNSVPALVSTALDDLASTGIYKSQTQNKVFASPNGSSGVSTIRALVNADLPSMANNTVKANISGSSSTPSDVAAVSTNTVSSFVVRDSSGNFSAGTITAALTGTASGNTTYTANQYGLVASGSGNAMSVIAPDASTTKLLVSGGSSANPSWKTVVNGTTAVTSAVGTVTTTATVDWSLSNVYTMTLTSGDTCVVSFSNAISGQVIVVEVTNGGSGGTGIVTWPTTKWAGGTQPVQSTGTAALDVWTFVYNGSYYVGSVVQNLS